MWAEVTGVRADAPAAAEVAGQSWIEVLDADPLIIAPLLILVGQGEAEAIALAQREPAAVLLMDDLRARKLAERLGLRRMGTVALLGQARRENLIPQLKPLSMGYWPRESSFAPNSSPPRSKKSANEQTAYRSPLRALGLGLKTNREAVAKCTHGEPLFG